MNRFKIVCVTIYGDILFLSSTINSQTHGKIYLWNKDSRNAVIKQNMTHEEQEIFLGELAFSDDTILYCKTIELDK